MSYFILHAHNVLQKACEITFQSENFILRQISQNFSDLGINVGEPWDTNYLQYNSVYTDLQ